MLEGGKTTTDKKQKSRRAALEKRAVWDGKREKTTSGLKKSDLAVSKSGQIVSKKKMVIGKLRMEKLRASGKAAAPFTKESARKARKIKLK